MTKERQLVNINIKEENGKQTVSARELHEKLGVTERFNSWFERMLAYGFEENVDFTSVKSFTLVNNGAKKPIDEYFISIDMAKEICMLQRSEKGKQFRQYFIECERRLIESNKRAAPQTYIEALERFSQENGWQYSLKICITRRKGDARCIIDPRDEDWYIKNTWWEEATK